jgi:hypothetical protein
LGAGLPSHSHVVEKATFCVQPGTRPERFLILAQPKNVLMRGFSHTHVSKSMNRWVRLPGNTLVFNSADFRETMPLEK